METVRHIHNETIASSFRALTECRCPDLQTVALGDNIGDRADEGLVACFRPPQRAIHRAFDGLHRKCRHACQVELKFPTLESAIRYAERQELSYVCTRQAKRLHRQSKASASGRTNSLMPSLM